ncbi:Uncharacterised protein [Candidatus Anstonella stagnisolia]|nr:Uncharacterised protein [Candidatus Anstonella stagnisolia]
MNQSQRRDISPAKTNTGGNAVAAEPRLTLCHKLCITEDVHGSNKKATSSTGPTAPVNPTASPNPSAAKTADDAFNRLYITYNVAMQTELGTGFPFAEELSNFHKIAQLNDAAPLSNLIQLASTRNQAGEIPPHLITDARAALERYREDYGETADFKTVEAFVNSIIGQGFQEAQRPAPTPEEALEAFKQAAVEMYAKVNVRSTDTRVRLSTYESFQVPFANLYSFIQTISTGAKPKILKNKLGVFIFDPSKESSHYTICQRQTRRPTFLPTAELLPQLISSSLATVREYLDPNRPQMRVLEAFINSPPAQELLAPRLNAGQSMPQVRIPEEAATSPPAQELPVPRLNAITSLFSKIGFALKSLVAPKV